MTALARDVLHDSARPVSILSEEALSVALSRMIESDFSQLPVVGSDERPLGVVTSDSILRALHCFGAAPKDLRVSDAMVKARTYSLNEELLVMLDENTDGEAMLVTDSSGKLSGMITAFDTTEYFRRRAEDLILIEDIETTLKDHIRAAYATTNGDIDEDSLNAAIVKVTSDGGDLAKRFNRAVAHYTGQPPDVARAADSFSKCVDAKKPPKKLEDLTFYDFTELVLEEGGWSAYFSQKLGVSRDAVRHLLESVRKTRNVLSHFRREVSPSERETLRFCNAWLGRRPVTEASRASDANQSSSAPGAASTQHSEASHSTYSSPDLHEFTAEASETSATSGNAATPPEASPPYQDVGEESVAGDSRYAPLAYYLGALPQQKLRERLEFRDVERILRGALPSFARRHRSWWANDSVGHQQSKLWLEAGWRVATVDVEDEVVEFARIQERQKLYINFFSEALTALQARSPKAPGSSPSGANWINMGFVGDRGRKIGVFCWSFAFGGRFRIELVIDTGAWERNKWIFDQLVLRGKEIEATAGEPLTWERLDPKRACRVALYHAGSILDAREELQKLLAWALDRTLPFEEALRAALVALHPAALPPLKSKSDATP